MWGRPTSSDVEGIYASTDGGNSWFRVNDDEHQFGGTGNGNFIVGDMNTYGTFYMSTVGAGIIYSRLVDDDGTIDKTTTTTTTKVTTVTEPTTTTTVKSNYSMSATVIKVDGQDVTLELEDGTTVTINLDSIKFYNTLNVGEEVILEFNSDDVATNLVTTIPSETTEVTTEDVPDTTTDDAVTTTDVTTSATPDDGGNTLLGDINLDGTVKANDLLLLKKHVLGIGTIESGSQAYTNADINLDGKIQANDLLMLKKHILGIININA
jgi:hypothetical protein